MRRAWPTVAIVAGCLIIGMMYRAESNRRLAFEQASIPINEPAATGQDQPTTQQNQEGQSSASSGGLVDRLTRKGWSSQAATAYLAQNGDVLEAISPAERLDRLVDRLGKIAEMRQSGLVFDQVARQPEIATLLAWVSARDAVFEAWRTSPANQATFLNLMLIQVDSGRVADLAKGWKRHGTAVANTWNRGLVGTEAVLIRRTSDDADEAFDLWLTRLFDTSAEPSPNDLAARLLLVIEQGPELRRRLRNPEFRRSFESLWDRLLTVTSHIGCPLGEFIRHPSIWDLLRRSDGVELATAYGAIPADLLYGKSAYESSLHPRVVRLLKSRMIVAAETLRRHDLREDGRFIDLLRRDQIRDEILLRIFDDFQRSKTGPGLVFEKISGKSDKEVADLYRDKVDLVRWDDNLRGYLKVPRRWLAGEPLDDQDLPKAFFDAVLDLANAGVFVAGSYFQVPVDPASEAIGYVREGVNNVLDDKTKRAIEEQKAQSGRVATSLTNNDSQKFLIESLQKITDQAERQARLTAIALGNLVEIQRSGAGRGAFSDDSAQAAFLLFYKSNPITANVPLALKDEGLAFRFSLDRRLYLAPKDDRTTAYSRPDPKVWGKLASRRWINQMQRDDERGK